MTQTDTPRVVEAANAVVAPIGITAHSPDLVGRVEEIIRIKDPILRNLHITLGYHELTMAMSRLLGSENLSWVGFATWASRTAGRFIRNDYMPNIVRAYMAKLAYFHRGMHFAHSVMTGVHRSRSAPRRSVMEETVERISRVVTSNIAMGNTSLFVDVGPVFARMVERFRDLSRPDRRALDEFQSHLRPGPVQSGGQELLRQAFGHYYHAIFETDRKRKAERILLANNLVGYHEQNRLQKHIYQSLNAPVAELIAQAAHMRARELTHERLRGPVDGMVDRMMRPFYRWLQREWTSVATRWLMRIELPEMSLSLGEDLPERCEHFMFPRDLMVIENPELAALLQRLDYTPDTVEGSAASNWASIEDRMNFIVDFFRTRQQDASLFSAPFTAEQISVIRRNGCPRAICNHQLGTMEP